MAPPPFQLTADGGSEDVPSTSQSPIQAKSSAGASVGTAGKQDRGTMKVGGTYTKEDMQMDDLGSANQGSLHQSYHSDR